ncbi:sulfotransferase [Demequina activiva]|uniref:Sulfotransferase n=2 Tax=Demequina activiva TaxID=1582364 RepID=A0A919Q120_9MICO|nr:sulfotransferase [Demequina activiva]
MAVPKEPGYLAPDLRAESITVHGDASRLTVRDEREYEACFAGATSSELLGDASTWYLYSTEAAQTVRRHNPQARIVAMLRDPVEMIASLHRQYLNETTEDIRDLASAIAAEPARAQGTTVPARAAVPSLLQYRARGHYGKQLQRWVDAFGRDALLVVLTSELRDSPEHTYRAVVQHIGADSTHRPAFRAVHEATQPRSRLLNRVARSRAITAPTKALLGQRRYTALQKRVVEPALMEPARRAPIDRELARALRDHLRPHVEEASAIVGRDLVKEWWTE